MAAFALPLDLKGYAKTRLDKLDKATLRDECTRREIHVSATAYKPTYVKALLQWRDDMAGTNKAPPKAKAKAPAPARPAPTVICPERIRGAALSRQELHTLLMDLVRDKAVSTRRDRVAAAQSDEQRPTHDYYLRREPPSKHVPEVDHVIECQLASFAVLAARETHGRLKAIAAEDMTKSRTNQTQVVQNLVTPLYDVHNSTTNLRLMDKTVNVSKGAVFKDFVKTLYASGHAAAHEEGIVRRMSNQFKHLKIAELNSVDVDGLAKSIGDEMLKVEDPYVGGIRGNAINDAIRRGMTRQEASLTMGDIADSVVQLYDDMDLTKTR